MDHLSETSECHRRNESSSTTLNSQVNSQMQIQITMEGGAVGGGGSKVFLVILDKGSKMIQQAQLG